MGGERIRSRLPTVLGWARRALGGLWPLAIYGALAVAFTWPLAEHLTSQKVYLGSDLILVHAILEWERFALFHDPMRFFDGNFYYLTRGALFFGDLLLGSLPIYAAFAAQFGPVGGFNVLYISTFTLNGAAMYLLLRRVTGAIWPSLLGGAVFAFAPIQYFFITNVQMLMAWWTPLMLWFLFGALRHRTGGYLAAALLALAMQFATSVYWGFFAAWMLVLFLAVSLVGRRFARGSRAAIRSLAFALLPVLALFSPLGWGYLQFFLDWRETRGFDEVVYQSATLPNYFEAAYRAGGAEIGPGPLRFVRPYLVSGLWATGAAVLGLVAVFVHQRWRLAVAVATLIVLTTFLFSLGPVLQWRGEPTGFSLPYRAAYEFLPGLQSLRAVKRWVLAAHLGVSLLAGVGLAVAWPAVRRVRLGQHVAGASLLILLAAEYAQPPPPLHTFPDEPQLMEALRTLPSRPAIVVPFMSNPEFEARMMSWSAQSSGLPLLNGYNGFIPPTQEHLGGLVNTISLDDAPHVYHALHALGVRLVILDTGKMSPGEVAAWTGVLKDLPAGSWQETVGRFVLMGLPDGGFTAVASSWRDLRTEVFIAGLAPGGTVTVPLNLLNPGSLPWVGPVPQRTHDLDIMWKPADGTPAQRGHSLFHPPPAILPQGIVTVPIRLVAPVRPGEYQLILRLGDIVLGQTRVRLETTLRPADDLAAELRLLKLTRIVRSGEMARLHISATNLGGDSWSGDVRLGYWWWYRGDSPRPSDFDESEGRLFINLDLGSPWRPVAPGASYTFQGAIQAPTRAGRYSLVVGLVREDVAWFAHELVDVHIVGAGELAPISLAELLGLEGDVLKGWHDEEYVIGPGSLLFKAPPSDVQNLALPDRRIRLVTGLELEALLGGSARSGPSRSPQEYVASS